MSKHGCDDFIPLWLPKLYCDVIDAKNDFKTFFIILVTKNLGKTEDKKLMSFTFKIP